ncbi:hypothetical protein [Ekhidna sp.]
MPIKQLFFLGAVFLSIYSFGQDWILDSSAEGSYMSNNAGGSLWIRNPSDPNSPALIYLAGQNSNRGLQIGREDGNHKILLNGNVGIGTTSPSFKLTVDGEVGIVKDYPYLQLNSTSWNAGSFIQTGVTTAAQPNGDYMVIHNPSSKGFNFRQGSYHALTILPSGNIGVGNTSPQFKFTVDGEIGIVKDYPYLQLNSTSWNGGSFIQTGVTTAAQPNGDYMVIHNPSSKGFNFRQGSYNAMTIHPSGKLGIGTTNPDSKLTVAGNIHAQEVKVTIDAGTGPDYVFEPDYDLRSLEETAAYIKANKHLPEVPSASEMEANGVQLGEMNMLLLKKIEELTLYVIELKKENEEQNEIIKSQEESINKIKNK